MKTILALDLATVTGYAIRKDSGRVESGSFDTRGKASDPPGARWANFRRFLVELKQANPDIAAIHFEDVRRHVSTQSAQVYGAFKALTELFGHHHGIPLHAIGVGTWKKRFCGNGAAKKGEILALCRDLGFKPVDDNEADALGILHVAIDRCPLLAPSPPPKYGAMRRKRADAHHPLPADGNPF